VTLWFAGQALLHRVFGPQSIPAGSLVTSPAPDRVTLIPYVIVPSEPGEKVAVTDFGASAASVHEWARPVQLPENPSKRVPEGALAVSVSESALESVLVFVPCSIRAPPGVPACEAET